MVSDLKKQGMSDVEIAKGMALYTENGKPWTTSDFRNAKTIANNEQTQADIGRAQRLRDKGLSNVKIGEAMGRNESSVRALLAPGKAEKADALKATSNMLRGAIADKKYIDVGVGTEFSMGISSTKLKTAVATLEDEGYKIHYIKVKQLGTGKETSIKVLAAPGITYSEVSKNRDQISLVGQRSLDAGHSFIGIKPPLDVHPDRVAIRYAEQGGAAADGVMYVRRGVPDISLGAANYAQVRVQVGGTHYIKGMAIYKDDLPASVDILFNTNKSNTGSKLDALKPLKTVGKDGPIDTENPFGTFVDQILNEKGEVSSAMNKVNDEGDWDKWSRTLSSQFLSKQHPALAKTQLNMTFEKKQQELEGIKALTNPLVRKTLLDKFADGADSSSVHLKAAALPRQATKVILPVNSMKPGEVYAPSFNNGERVVLIRHPHGGTFEIPELVVNNKNAEARKLLGTSTTDAIGIHSSVANKLSGADFDGDTVLVIPNDRGAVKHAPALKELGNFDAKADYPHYEGMKVMHKKDVQAEMGGISNLITDMTIQGANNGELARAVRHSMVVIDAEKHKLDYKRSAIDNGIAQLKKRYQGGATAGASTLISRAKSEVRIPDRKARTVGKGGPIDLKTGEKKFEETGVTTVRRKINKKTGEVTLEDTPKLIKSVKLAETTDAHTLSSGTRIEQVYADHSNKLKALANTARLASVHTKTTNYSPSASKVYASEVASLSQKLTTALENAPRERQAQLLANAILSQKRAANPEMEPSDVKKLKGHALAEARIRTGADKQRIEITDREWTAIQAGAISNERLGQILANTDLDRIKELATPRTITTMTSDKKLRAEAMLMSGYTQSEVAAQLGVSVSTLQRSVSG
jgi:DNA-binding CsgD family transcriptional regulator